MKLVSRKINVVCLTAFYLLSFTVIIAQPALSLKNSSYTYLKSNLEFLASDELEGRGATTRGEKLAALYISEELEKYGVLPYGDSGSYYQDFNMIVTRITGESTVDFIKDDSAKTFNHGENIVYSSRSLPTDQFKGKEYEIVFAGYGIFSGKSTHKAVLRFTRERARWVSREIWHSEQEGHFDKEGKYVLTIPYSSDTELVMDVMRYGADVEVLSPGSLRRRLKQSLWKAAQQYG